MSDREKRAVLWLAVVLAIYLTRVFAVSVLPISGRQYAYFEILLSIGVSIFLFKRPKTIKQTPLKFQMRVHVNAIIYLMIYVASFVGLGMVDGFGNNPLDTSPKGILYNMLFFMPSIVLFEFIRDRVLNSVRKKWRLLFQLVIIAMYTFTAFKINQWAVLGSGDLELTVEFIGKRLIPVICLQILMNEAVLKGGIRTALIIQVGLNMITYVFPVLPNLRWITEALLNILLPIFGLPLLAYGAPDRQNDKAIKREENHGSFSSLAWGLLSVLIVWFSLGIFPVFPTVILTGSMEPYIMPGDVVIVKETDSDDLQVGDVIQFWSEGIYIIHRVIDIENGEYKTKGDNNNAPDSDLVPGEYVKGKMIYKIPIIGKPIVYMKTQDETILDSVRERYELGGDE